MPSDDEANSGPGSENENEENAQEAPEYVKKEFVARPYSNPKTESEVVSMTPKNSR
jgi:hypothetical protein